MKELQNRLTSDLTYVDTVWFDADGNWYVNQGLLTISKTKDEILSVTDSNSNKKTKEKITE